MALSSNPASLLIPFTSSNELKTALGRLVE